MCGSGNWKEFSKMLLMLDFFFYSPVQFLTSGAGSKAWRGDIKKQKTGGLKFFYDGQGFMSVQLTRDAAEIAFYDVSGNVLHRWTTTKLLYSSI